MDEIVNKKIILFIATIGSFLTPFMGSAIVVALPSIGKEFTINAVVLNWVAASFLLSSAIFVVPFGRMADIFGRKRIYLYGVIIFTFASIFCGFSSSPFMLIFGRTLQGLGAAMIFGTGLAILASVFPQGERGKALGVNVAAVYMGLAVGPLLGGILTQHLGWRSIFFVNTFIGIMVIILILLKIKHEWIEAENEKFDYIGSVIYGIALFGIMYGLSSVLTEWGMILFGVGTVSILCFVFFETRTKSPILQMSLFRKNKVLIFSTLAALINYSATFAVSYLLSLYLQYIKGFEPQQAGLVLLVQPAVQALLSPFAGKLSDKIEPQIVASLGMGLTTAGLLMFVFLNSNTKIIYILTGLILLGFGFALFSSPNTNAVMGSVEKKYYGIISGLLGTVRLVGQTFSMAITALVFSLYVRGVQITQQYHLHFIDSMRVLFIIFSNLCFIGIFASMARGKRIVV